MSAINPHTKLGARIPHVAMFCLAGIVYAVSAVFNDLGNIFAQFMSAAPAIGGLLHVIYHESQVAKTAYDTGSSASTSQAVGTAISALTTIMTTGPKDIEQLKAFAQAVIDAAKQN